MTRNPYTGSAAKIQGAATSNARRSSPTRAIDAGAYALVIETVPQALAADITKAVSR
jgi:ketopantoate hydroxymethyltransferase